MYAYKTIEEFEGYVNYKASEAFRMGWNMARVTNEMLGIKEEPLKKEVLGQLLRDSNLFCNLEVDQIYFECKTNTLGSVLRACRKFDIGLCDEAITNLANRFINA